MNIVHFIQQILCFVGITFIKRLYEFIQLQELQFKILQQFWSFSKFIQKGTNITYNAYCFKIKHHKF